MRLYSWPSKLSRFVLVCLLLFTVTALVSIAAAYQISDYFTGIGINSAVYYQLWYGFDGVNFNAFKGVIAAAIGAILLIVICIFALVRWGRRQHQLSLLLATVASGAVIALHPGTMQIATVTGILPPEPAAIAYHDWFVSPEAKRVKLPKNLVLIYAESFNRVFMDDAKFPGILNDLKALRLEALDFDSISSPDGTTWTMGGITASQCGIPLAVGGGEGNILGNEVTSFLPNATCIGDILRREGYQTAFVQGAQLSFAGKGKFFTSHGYETVLGRDELATANDQVNEWGRYDHQTFASALEQYQQMMAKGGPILLSVLTVDTHPPHGFPEIGCGAGMIAAVDCSGKEIARFIRSIRALDPNVVVVLMSDHPMPNSAVSAQIGDRSENTLLIWGAGVPPKVVSRRGSTFDITPTVLPMIGVSSSGFGLGRNLLGVNTTLVEATGGPTEAYFTLVKWNTTQSNPWLNENTLDAGITLKSGGLLAGEETFGLPILFVLNKDGSTIDAGRFNPYSKFAALAETADRLILVDMCNQAFSALTQKSGPSDNLCVLSYDATTAQVRMAAEGHVIDIAEFEGDDVGRNEISRRAEHIRSAGTLPEFDIGEARSAILTSMGGDIGLAAYYEAPGHEPTPLPGRGINVLSGKSLDDLVVVKSIDTCLPTDSDQPWVYTGGLMVVVVNDSALCGKRPEWAISGIELPKLHEVGFRQPYVAIVDDGVVEDFLGERFFPLIVRR